MRAKYALIFGYNEYSKQMGLELDDGFTKVESYVLNETYEHLKDEDRVGLLEFDLSDDWDEIAKKYNEDEIIIYCALDNDAQNIFLTISLREVFKNAYMIALGQNSESSQKLLLAGASKVIPILQTTANIITEILEKPIITSMIHDILFEDSDLKIAQITLKKYSAVDGVKLHKVAWQEHYGVIVMAVVDKEMSNSFLFTSKGYNHLLDAGDILVVVGYNEDIHNLETEIGESNESYWRNWRR